MCLYVLLIKAIIISAAIYRIKIIISCMMYGEISIRRCHVIGLFYLVGTTGGVFSNVYPVI